MPGDPPSPTLKRRAGEWKEQRRMEAEATVTNIFIPGPTPNTGPYSRWPSSERTRGVGRWSAR